MLEWWNCALCCCAALLSTTRVCAAAALRCHSRRCHRRVPQCALIVAPLHPTPAMSGFVRSLWGQSTKLLSRQQAERDEGADDEEQERDEAEQHDDEEEGEDEREQQQSHSASLQKQATAAAPSPLAKAPTPAAATATAAKSTASPAASGDIASLAQRVLSLVATDLSAAEQLSHSLPPVDLSGVDLSLLDPRGRYLSSKRKQQPEGSKADAAATSAAAVQRKRVKRRARVRYPAGFDPAAPNNPPPDPERWLPKWERTIVDKKGRRKQRDAPLRGAQGSAAATNLALQHGIATPIGVTGSSGYVPSSAASTSTSAAPTSAASTSSAGEGQSTGTEQRSDSNRPAAGSAAAAAARKKKKGKK